MLRPLKLRLPVVWAVILFLGCGREMMARAGEFDSSHHLFDQVLNRFVKDDSINYSALKANRADLDNYLDQLGAVTESSFNGWRQEDQIAFLINLYNASTLRLIIDHYPVASVRDINIGFGVGDENLKQIGLGETGIGSLHFVLRSATKRKTVQLWGRTASLDKVESLLLRKQYSEPRVHFALVRATRSSPSLRMEAYTGRQLDHQLEDQAHKFMADTRHNRVDIDKTTIYLSSVIRLHGCDFQKNDRSVLEALKPYWPEAVQAQLSHGDFKVAFNDCDWSLNDSPEKK